MVEEEEMMGLEEASSTSSHDNRSGEDGKSQGPIFFFAHNTSLWG